MVESVHSASVINGNGGGNRFLRTSKVIEDGDNDSEEDLEDDTEDNSEDEERGLLDVLKNASLKNIDDLADDLSAIPGMAKCIKDETNETLKLIAALKWTPDDMALKLGIAEKKATMSKDVLKNDPDYLLWRHYSKFWDARRAKA
ncbi:hypothetical protein BBJ29_010132 [Phytophthora kernoviae]|uniref:Uncharacterized protein n=1 Tax=Phytophthora kernoviae TaxID=325452 RepID=A0A3F2RAM4_9STRA|nr:hypothetical protein BBP00_00010113 [Phytophthora kernoviae]RLN66862.1 hypothetical protein BBJ29_010132 [Phytophthora kernoviae]